MDQKTKFYRSHCHGISSAEPLPRWPKNHSTQTSKTFGSSFTIAPWLHNQQGFGAIFLLSILPVILALMIGILMLVTIEHALLGPRQICRKEIVAFESKSAEHLQILEALNLQIKALRLEELKLKVELVIAIAAENWPAAALIKSKLTVVTENFQKIRIEQNLVLDKNKLSAEILKASLTRQFSFPFKNLAYSLKSFATLSITQTTNEIKTLAVRPDNAGSIAPVYELEEPFIQKQSSQAFWRIEVRIQTSSWASHWFRSKYSWQDSCAGSLQKANLKWQPILIQTTRAKF